MGGGGSLTTTSALHPSYRELDYPFAPTLSSVTCGCKCEQLGEKEGVAHSIAVKSVAFLKLRVLDTHLLVFDMLYFSCTVHAVPSDLLACLWCSDWMSLWHEISPCPVPAPCPSPYQP